NLDTKPLNITEVFSRSAKAYIVLHDLVLLARVHPRDKNIRSSAVRFAVMEFNGRICLEIISVGRDDVLGFRLAIQSLSNIISRALVKNDPHLCIASWQFPGLVNADIVAQ